MGVSLNGGTPKSCILIGDFHYKSSILGDPLFLETPIFENLISSKPLYGAQLRKEIPAQVPTWDHEEGGYLEGWAPTW